MYTVLATFDFETRGSAGYDWNPATRKWQSLPGFAPINRGLSVVGTRVYVEHWSFAPVLLAYDLTPQFGGATAVQWEYGQPFNVLFPLFEYIKAGGLISAFNAEFEREVWNYYCVPVWGWPPLKIEQQRCDAAASRAAGYPGALAKAAAVLRTPTQKDADGDRLMKIFSMPRNPTKDNDSLFVMPADAPDDWARYKSYNRTDIIAEHEVSERVPPISDAEQRRWILDQKINDRGMAVDSKAVEDCISIFEQASDRYGAEFRSVTGGIEHSELKQFQGWLHSRGVHLDDMTEKSIDAAINRLTIPEYVVDGEIPPPLSTQAVSDFQGPAALVVTRSVPPTEAT